MTQIKYVYVEMISRGETKQDVVTGLFGGIFKHEGETYILLHGKKDCMSVLNTKCYDIMTIEMLEPDFKNMLIATMDRKDQTDIFNTLNGYYTQLVAAGFSPKPGSQVIDIKKYTEIPEGYLEGKPAGDGYAQTMPNSAGDFATNRTRYNKGQNGSYSQIAVKPDPTPAFMERSKTKRPTKEFLTALSEKITGIGSGAVIPFIPEELVNEVATETSKSPIVYNSQDDLDKELYGYGGMY